LDVGAWGGDLKKLVVEHLLFESEGDGRDTHILCAASGWLRAGRGEGREVVCKLAGSQASSGSARRSGWDVARIKVHSIGIIV